MEAAFRHWTHNTPAAHLYGIYASQHSLRLGLHHSREQLHSPQQTMYFDDSIYPHLSQPLLGRILRIRALVDHATDDLTAALGHVEATGKGKGTQPIPPDPADERTTSRPHSPQPHPHYTTRQRTTNIITTQRNQPTTCPCQRKHSTTCHT